MAALKLAMASCWRRLARATASSSARSTAGGGGGGVVRKRGAWAEAKLARRARAMERPSWAESRGLERMSTRWQFRVALMKSASAVT